MKYIKTDAGREYKRASRWIKINLITITPRHRLYDYACTAGFDHDDERGECWVFRHGGRLYALDQFMRLTAPEFFTNEEGKTSFLSGYDYTNWYDPYHIEIHPDGEYIRLFEVVRQ